MCVCVCVSGLSGKDPPQVQKRSREFPRLSVFGSGPTSMVPSPSYCLPSEGLPLCCPPAKVHTSPATPRWGLPSSPTSRVWAHSHPSPQIGGIATGLWVWPPGLSRSEGQQGSQAGALSEEGEGAWLAGYLRGHWLGWRAVALPQSWCENQALDGDQMGVSVQGEGGS